MASSHIIRSRRNCCVVNCGNNEAKNPDLQFYRFPGRSRESERKMRWIKAVKRIESANRLWTPTSNSRICSAHFIGGKKSDDPSSESYDPMIFPPIYKTKIPSPSRRKRLLNRRERAAVNSEEMHHKEDVSSGNFLETPKMISFACQTDPYVDDNCEGSEKILFCWNGDNVASTQTIIRVENSRTCGAQKVIVSTQKEVITKNKSCGTDAEMAPGFIGYQDIDEDQSMRQLAGVSRSVFTVLLGLIIMGKDGQPQYYKKITRENRLLIFLMKLKLGISFSALGCLFKVHGSTVSTIFFQMLQTLTLKTRSWIFWPSKESVQKNLPAAFHNYPNCRCIIDCTEIFTDTPLTVEQRNLFFSNYKWRYTNKILIAITPDGYICKVSKAYGGRATDCFITNDSGLLDSIEPGDLVLADKGFPQIQSELSKRNATLVIPPFAMNPQFTDEEVNEGYKIASVRIHVERAIQRIKIFNILRHIPATLIPYVDAIMHMCCVLANTQPPLIKSINESTDA